MGDSETERATILDRVSALRVERGHKKINVLQAILGDVLHSPQLLPDALPAILELQADPDADVRNSLSVVLEALCPQVPQSLPSCGPALLSLVQDASLAVAKRAMAAVTVLAFAMLRFAAGVGESPPTADALLPVSPKDREEVWGHLCALRDQMSQMAARPSRYVCVRSHLFGCTLLVAPVG
eukprot:jgi/Mesvir1/2562/Mv01999-RA.1